MPNETEIRFLLDIIPLLEGLSQLGAVLVVGWLVWRAAAPIITRLFEVVKQYLEKQQELLAQNTRALESIAELCKTIVREQEGIKREVAENRAENRTAIATLSAKVDVLERKIDDQQRQTRSRP